MRVLSTMNPADITVYAAVVEKAAELQTDRDKTLAVMIANALNGHPPK